MHKIFLTLAALQGMISVMLGAFGAHALKNYLTQINRVEVFETAVKYMFYHTFALLAIGILYIYKPNSFLYWSGYSFITGTVIFSGSLLILCFTNVSKWGAITPIGGVFLILGWILLAINSIKYL
ncbi:MAG: DUF423 domain-containing protein [Cytophagales bacterium]|nr:MAG: DUF423 domain-containing protein [Cytophagales bacterium]